MKVELNATPDFFKMRRLGHGEPAKDTCPPRLRKYWAAASPMPLDVPVIRMDFMVIRES
jgi:hypothetical protein